MCCKGPCCHGTACNVALRTLSLILGLLAFCIHCAAAGHTFWLCFDILCHSRMGLFHYWNGFIPYEITGDYAGGYLGACQAFSILAILSSFMAFIFMCVRFCVVKKAVEGVTLFFLFGAMGAEFLTWVIFVGVRAGDLTTTIFLSTGFNCSIVSMIFSFLCLVMIAVSVKITGPIVRKEQVVVVQQPTVVVAGQPGGVVYSQQPGVVYNQQPGVVYNQQPGVAYNGQPGQVNQTYAPPAYASEENKQQPTY